MQLEPTHSLFFIVICILTVAMNLLWLQLLQRNTVISFRSHISATRDGQSHMSFQLVGTLPKLHRLVHTALHIVHTMRPSLAYTLVALLWLDLFAIATLYLNGPDTYLITAYVVFIAMLLVVFVIKSPVSSKSRADQRLSQFGQRRRDEPSVTPYESSARFLKDYKGTIRLPHKVYEKSSANLIIDLSPSDTLRELQTLSHVLGELNFDYQHSIPGNLRITIRFDTIHDQILEVELLAAGFSSKGDSKQHRHLGHNPGPLSLFWNCYFPDSGPQSLILAFRLLSPHTTELGRLEHVIKVVKVLGLTQQQLFALACAVTILTTILGVLKVLTDLKLL